MLHDLFWGSIKLGLFLQYGLPLIFGVMMMFCCIFMEGMPLSFKGTTGRKPYFVQLAICLAAVFLGYSLNGILGLGIFVLALIGIYADAVRRVRDMGGSIWAGLGYIAVVFCLDRIGSGWSTAVVFLSYIGLGLVPSGYFGKKDDSTDVEIRE